MPSQKNNLQISVLSRNVLTLRHFNAGFFSPGCYRRFLCVVYAGDTYII